jgi:ELWxxDGT repeat protein
MRTFYLLFLLLFISSLTQAQEPLLVKDFNEGPGPAFEGRFNNNDEFYNQRRGLEVDDETIVFALSDSLHGEELGVLKNGNLSLLMDIYPGASSSKPSWFTRFNNAIYFSAIDSVKGGSIWRTDGTTNGTELVIDVDTVVFSGFPTGLTVSKSGHLYFTYGKRLFRSDGTQSGTTELFDNINFEINRTWRTPHFDTYKDGVAFLTKNADNRIQLWAATDTVRMLGELSDPSRWGIMFALNQVKAGLIFTVYDSANNDLTGTYSYNDTSQLIEKFYFGNSSPQIRRALPLNEEIQIAAVDGLGYYSINGNENGNIKLPLSGPSSLPQTQTLNSILSNNKLIFNSNSPFFDEVVSETDGTIAGTRVLATIGNSGISNFVEYDDYIFWLAGNINSSSLEFYYTNTSNGLTERYFVWEPENGRFYNELILGVQDGKLFFMSEVDPAIGRELYVFDLEFGPFVSTYEAQTNPLFELKQTDEGFFIYSDRNEDVQINIFDTTGKFLEKRTARTNTFVKGIKSNQVLFYNFRCLNTQITKKVLFTK